MKKVAIVLSLCTLCVLSVCTIFVLSAGAQQQPKPYVNKQAPMEHWSGLLRLVETIPIPTEGYIDHLSYDLKNQHLFISGENNKKLVVVDMKAGKVIHETPLVGNPRKPFFDAATNELWLDLGDNSAVAISGTTFEVTKTVELTGGKGAAHRDPDNAAYDPVKGLYYVGIVTGQGNKDGTVEIVDTKAGKLVGSIKREGNDPAGMRLDRAEKRLD